MDQRYKVAATEVEKIQKKHAKQIPDDVKAGLIGLISDLKKGAKSKNKVKTKFDILERAIKTKKPDLWKLLEDIQNSLDIDSMGIFGASNSSIQSEERARADSEMAFMVDCFRAILEILQDNGDTSIFPMPAERLTEKVSEGYGYASKVASLCKEQKRIVKTLDEQIKKLQDELSKKEVRIIQLQEEKDKLSETAGSKTTHENASIAELSDPNRPTKLGEKYLELYNFQWTDAYRNISTKHPSYSDEKVIGSLYDILIDGYRFCQGARQTQKLSLEEILLYPAGGLEPISGNQKERAHEMFSGHLSEAAKVSSDLTRVNIVKAFVTNEQTKKKYGEIMKVCETFIDVCVQLCWQMQVQTPPVFLDLKTVKGQAFVSEIYKEYTRKGNKIAYVVWPALFLHENGPLLVKGFAQGE